jgi:hypothetical protein
MSADGTWQEWSKFVLKTLEQIQVALEKGEDRDKEVREELQKQIHELKDLFLKELQAAKDTLNSRIEVTEKDLLALKIKAGLIGGGAGGGLGVIAVVINLLTGS